MEWRIQGNGINLVMGDWSDFFRSVVSRELPRQFLIAVSSLEFETWDKTHEKVQKRQIKHGTLGAKVSEGA